jgi:hypothetical protein
MDDLYKELDFITSAWMFDHDPGDYLLINNRGQIVAVSGNSEFWDEEETMPELDQEKDSYLIVKVVEIQSHSSKGMGLTRRS